MLSANERVCIHCTMMTIIRCWTGWCLWFVWCDCLAEKGREADTRMGWMNTEWSVEEERDREILRSSVSLLLLLGCSLVASHAGEILSFNILWLRIHILVLNRWEKFDFFNINKEEERHQLKKKPFRNFQNYWSLFRCHLPISSTFHSREKNLW